MTRVCLLAILAAASMRAAVIRGVVVENFTGKLLARAQVTLEPMEGTPGETRSVRAGSLGGFEFDRLAGGAYVVKASRRGFIPAQAGQKRWNSAGQPIVLEEPATTFLTIRLPRFSTISGTIVDENDIGLPSHEVAVYRNTQPPELIREGITDDRGIYRVGGLEPGRYVVRSVGKEYAEGGYLPTFSREATRLEQARAVDVFLEQQTDNIDVRPVAGQVYSLSVGVETDPPGLDVTLTLSSAMGRTTVKAARHRFTGLAPGDYEVYSEADAGPGSPVQGSYQRVVVRRDAAVTLLPLPSSEVTVLGAPAAGGGELWIRRKDLAGVLPRAAIPLERGRGSIPAGRWELLLNPPSGYYVSSTFPFGRERPEGWHEFQARGYGGPRFTLSAAPGRIRGVVKDAPYAPVYLEAYDPVGRKRVGELRATRADAHGQYRFDNLAPGAYRLLSTFEYLLPDTETIDSAAPVGVTVDAHGEQSRDLELWLIR